jgi:predicted RNA methylase
MPEPIMPPTESAHRILAEHYRYLTDTVRIEAFRKALAGAVTPSDVVLDLGCGTGVLGFLAVEAGARTVIGIEQSGLIQVARTTASRLGLGSRTHYVRGHSTAVSVSPKATLLVCDQLDPLGFEAGLLESVADARRRLLTLDAKFVPAAFET